MVSEDNTVSNAANKEQIRTEVVDSASVCSHLDIESQCLMQSIVCGFHHERWESSCSLYVCWDDKAARVRCKDP
jgi:hypothetical protein